MRLPAFGDRHLSVGASLIPVASTLAMTPILTRTLGSTEFGLWATLFTILGTVQLVDLGVGSSLLRFMVVVGSDEGRAGTKRYLASAWLYYVIIAILSLVVVLPWHEELYRFVATRTSSPGLTIVMFFCLVALMPISNAAIIALQSVGDFKQIAAIVLCSQVLYALIVVVGSRLPSFSVGTVLIAQMFQVVTVFAYVTVHLKMLRANRLLTRPEVRQFSSFSTRVWLTNLSSVAVLQLPIIIVAAMVAPSEVGIYGLAAMIALGLRNIPLTSLAPIVRNLTGTVDEIVNRSRVADRTWRKGLTVYTALGVVGIVIGAPILGGPSYARAVGPCLLLFAGYIIQLWGALATTTSRQLELTKVEWRATALGAAIHLALIWFAILALGLYGPGVVLIISQTVTLIFVRRQFRSFSRPPAHLYNVS
jgi:O-antigen/teichoic acid export membrane protein